MARVSKTDKMARQLQEMLSLSLTASDIVQLPTMDIITKLVDLINTKEQSDLADRLLTELRTRDLTELAPTERLKQLSSLITKTKLPPENTLSLAELENIRDVRKKELTLV